MKKNILLVCLLSAYCSIFSMNKFKTSVALSRRVFNLYGLNQIQSCSNKPRNEDKIIEIRKKIENLEKSKLHPNVVGVGAALTPCVAAGIVEKIIDHDMFFNDKFMFGTYGISLLAMLTYNFRIFQKIKSLQQKIDSSLKQEIDLKDNSK